MTSCELGSHRPAQQPSCCRLLQRQLLPLSPAAKHSGQRQLPSCHLAEPPAICRNKHSYQQTVKDIPSPVQAPTGCQHPQSQVQVLAAGIPNRVANTEACVTRQQCVKFDHSKCTLNYAAALATSTQFCVSSATSGAKAAMQSHSHSGGCATMPMFNVALHIRHNRVVFNSVVGTPFRDSSMRQVLLKS